MKWVRPTSVPYPKIWHRFWARDVTVLGNTSDQLVEYRVEDLTEDRYEDVLRHFTQHFIEDEPLAAHRGVPTDADAMEDQREFWRSCFNQKVTVVCYKDGSDEIVGANLLQVKMIDDERRDYKVRSQSSRDIMEIHRYMMNERCNVFQYHRVDRYLNAVGLAINRRYRGIGIATEMLRARVAICRAFHLPVTVTDFTARGSQRAAEKAGFRTDVEVTYEELASIQPNFAYPGIKEKSMKMMSLVIVVID